MWANWRLRDWMKVWLGDRGWIWAAKEVALCLSAVCVLAYFFYRSFWAIPPLLPLGLGLAWHRHGRRSRVRQEQREAVFGEWALSVSAAMRAGYSLENAVIASIEDMASLFGSGSEICRELSRIREGIRFNQKAEDLLEQMGRRWNLDMARDLAAMVAVAKKTGGNLPGLMDSFGNMVFGQKRLREEMAARQAGRRMEQTIMNWMPLGIMLYVDIANQGYFAVLYRNAQGVAIMTALLAIYVGGYAWSEHILDRG